jgi:hypothetical protein
MITFQDKKHRSVHVEMRSKEISKNAQDVTSKRKTHSRQNIAKHAKKN